MYPIKYTFKRIALTNKVVVTDASGNEILYAHQQLLKLKEKILVFRSSAKDQQVGELNADRVIDFSPLLTFTNSAGQQVVSVKRNGRASIWRASYEILNPEGQTLYSVREQNVWAKVGDALFAEIPVVGLLSGYVFQPRYGVMNAEGQVVATIQKRPAFLESSFELTCENPQTSDPSGLLPVAILAVLTRERARG